MAKPNPTVPGENPLIWLLLIVVPLGLYAYLAHTGVDRSVAVFSGIAAVTLICWIFSLVADFIPALLALLMLMVFGLVPGQVALSGFSSDGFLIAFSVMGLGAVISSSGLANRYTLWALSRIPSHSLAFQALGFFTGLVMNPVVPTITARAAITGPVLNHLADRMEEPDRKKQGTLLYLSGLDGINYLSPVFLTAAPANLMVFGLFPAQDQAGFQFAFWAYAASVTGVIMLAAYFMVSFIFFKGYGRVKMDKQRIQKQYKELGPICWEESIALAGILLLALGIVTAGLHRIPVSLVSFGVICFLLGVNVLSRTAFIREIDWGFLFLMAGIIGIMASMKHLGLDQMIVARFQGFQTFMRLDFYTFVLVLTCTTLVVRLFIPLNSAIVILAAALVPMAGGAGISPWVVGFIILIMAETAFFGYQSPYILFFRNLTAGHLPYNENRVRLFHALLVLCKLGAIYGAIPFWKTLGIL